MTPAERDQPEDHRRLPPGPDRAGVGTRQVSDVNQLVDRFFEARKMMESMARGRRACPGMPGMPGMGGKRARRPSSRRRRSGRSAAPGNPAKRAAQERASRRPAKPGQPADGAAAFGFGTPAGKDAADLPSSFELPKELKDLL